MTGKTRKLIVLFDGYCILCSRTVDFIIRRDRKDLFRFAQLQQPGAAARFPGAAGEGDAGSVILIENGKAWYRSSAVLRIMRHLSSGWPLLYFLIVIPEPVRDFFYKFVAKRRYRWFGRYDKCMVPGESIRGKFTGNIPGLTDQP